MFRRTPRSIFFPYTTLFRSLMGFLSNNAEMARYLNILYIEGSGEIAVFLCGLIGACLGFLWYNGYPAQIFMGDTGSLALRSEEHTSELQSHSDLVCRLLLEK